MNSSGRLHRLLGHSLMTWSPVQSNDHCLQYSPVTALFLPKFRLGGSGPGWLFPSPHCINSSSTCPSLQPGENRWQGCLPAGVAHLSCVGRGGAWRLLYYSPSVGHCQDTESSVWTSCSKQKWILRGRIGLLRGGLVPGRLRESELQACLFLVLVLVLKFCALRPCSFLSSTWWGSLDTESFALMSTSWDQSAPRLGVWL